ncbi:MAG: RecX family transcriptional regulator [Chloroflexota bacterium]
MPVVTLLEPQRRDPERVNVYLDGEFAFGTSRLIVAAYHLVVGSTLTQEETHALRHDDGVDQAFNAALNLLSYRPRSAGEIRQYFRQKGIDARTAEAALEKLAGIGLVNDHEFARFWIENRTNIRPRGSRAIQAELRQKGLEPEIIEGALAERGDEADLAYTAGLKKLRAYSSYSGKEFTRRMLGFLERRGFAYVSAAAATKRLAEEASRTGEGDELPITEEIDGA